VYIYSLAAASTLLVTVSVVSGLWCGGLSARLRRDFFASLASWRVNAETVDML
jgi:hypothetical protein